MVKRILIVLGVLVTLIVGLYTLPNFIPLNNGRKTYIENKIEELIKFDIDIKGKISFTILPYPAIILKNVDVKNVKSSDKAEQQTFLNASQIFVSMDLIDLIKGNFKINKIIIDGGYFNYSVYASTGFENLSLFLKGKNFNDLIIKDSTVIQYDESLDNIRRFSNVNMKIKNTTNSQINGTGSFSYLSNKVDNLTFNLKFIDNENYNLNIDFNYVNGKSSIINKFNIVVKENNPIVNGTINLITDNLYKFTSLVDSSISIPNIPLFNEKLIMKATLQTTPDAIILSNGTFSSDSAYATFSSILPLIKTEDDKTKIVKENITFNADFKNLKLEKILKLPKNIFEETVSNMDELKEVIKLLSYANMNIVVKNLLLDKSLITNFELNSNPVYQDGKITSLNIGKLGYKIGKNSIQVNGTLSDLSNNVNMDLNIKDTIPFNYPNKFFNTISINSFTGQVIRDINRISIPSFDIDVGGNKIFGNLEETINSNSTDYNITIKSESIDTSKFTKNNIDLAYIIHNLSLLKNTNFKLSAMVKSLKTPNTNYDLFKLDSIFKNDTLSVKRLTFANSGYTSNINGDLIGITGNSGSFKNFNYIITSENLKGIRLPFIRNNFVDKIISNGVKQVNIKLNGDASNPVSDIYAILNDISVKVNGHLLEGDERYTLDLSHSELKGFLFSWGIIDDTLMNYFYDNIPFTLQADVDGDNINNIKLTIKNNVFTGNISRKNVSRNKKEPKIETSVNLQIDKLDVKSIIKRLKDADGYVDFLLKIIRALPYDITLTAKNIAEYNSNNYKDLYFKLVNASNPGSLEFNMQKGNMLLKLTSEILNNRIFTGNLNVKNYTLPNDLMNNELMNLTSGIMDINLDFKTDGLNIYQLTSNLSGNFDAQIKNGTIKGISSYDETLFNIVELANITTNNILYIIENSFKSGNLNFTDLDIKGKINSSEITKATFTLNAKNMLVNGFVSGNLINKSLNIESVFEIKNLSTEMLNIIYNLKGFINNMEGSVDVSNLMSKINTSYLQKKKKELLN
ncbi:MAG: AsmA family protein [Alphaproteobacteria bacterium]